VIFLFIATAKNPVAKFRTEARVNLALSETQLLIPLLRGAGVCFRENIHHNFLSIKILFKFIFPMTRSKIGLHKKV
jgi:hypothetical protein